MDAISTASGQMYKALYHEADTRFNMNKIPAELEPSSRARIEQQACSIACLVDRSFLIETNSNNSTQFFISPTVLTLAQKLKTGYEAEHKTHYAEQNRPSAEEETQVVSYNGPFHDEPSLGDGTAFLVGKQLILTAAHCICDKSGFVSRVKLTGLRVLFGFQMQSSGEVRTKFTSKDVYRIEAVWRYRLKDNEADWALLKLDREVEGRDSLSLATSQAVSLNTALYMLGYPSGLPLKLTMSGQVQKTNNPLFFETDLDAFAGNSGSPIFENGTGNMIGMLLRGNHDYAISTSLNKDVTIHVSKVSKKEIESLGYEKCHKIASIGFVKTVLSSSFKMAHSHFSGRTKQLADLKAHLTAPSSSTRVQILYGPGGVGKSELAIAFANQSIEDFSFIWSISCGTEGEHFVGYHGLAKRLEIPLDEKETLPSLINKVHRRLEQNRGKPWLLLFDNIQISPEPLHFPPLPNKGGSILITSYKSLNMQSLPPEAVIATEVLPLEPEEALKFLENVTEKPSHDCKKLLSHVGCYPLVLGQVASYIKHTGSEVEEYLTTLEQHHSISSAQDHSSKTPKMALEAAFNMTFQQLFPAAKKWLFLCSHLSAAFIPVSYLKAWLDSERYSEGQVEIITALEERALLRYNVQEKVFSLHLEFQRILRALAPEEIGSQVAQLLVNMGKSWDFENTTNWGETMKKATIWASHTEPVVKIAVGMSLNGSEKASLLDGLGTWEYASTRYDKALAYYREALEIRKIALGGNHPDVATILNNIGVCYDSQGNYTEALKMHSEALKIRRAALGENHLNVARSLNNVGSCHYYQRNYTEALEVYSKALKIQKAVFGENDPDVATSLSNIGNCYTSQGNYIEALKLFLKALEIGRAVLGENHPDIATSLNNIGNCYTSQRNYTEALKFYREALKIGRTVLKENHPEVAKSLNNIGGCYQFQGNYAEALKLFGEALKIGRAVLGENHPDVATSLNNMGGCYQFLGNYTEALKLHVEAHRIRRTTLAENHPDVAMTLRNIKQCQARSKSEKRVMVYFAAFLSMQHNFISRANYN